EFRWRVIEDRVPQAGLILLQRVRMIVAEKNVLLKHFVLRLHPAPCWLPGAVRPIHAPRGQAGMIFKSISRINEFVGTRGIQQVGIMRELALKPFALESSVRRPA